MRLQGASRWKTRVGCHFVPDDESAANMIPNRDSFSVAGLRSPKLSSRPGRAKPHTRFALLPIVLCDALIHHRLKTGVLFDEDLAECPVLPQKNGLKTH